MITVAPQDVAISKGALSSEEDKSPESANRKTRRRKDFFSNYERARAASQQLRRPWYIIDPRTAWYIPWWDLVTAVALVFTATLTPYEVGFLPAAKYPSDAWFIMNRIVDFIFLSDFTLQFFLGYMATDGKAGWVFEPRKIACHYMTSFFFPLDVLSIGVAVFDWLELEAVQRAVYGPPPLIAGIDNMTRIEKILSQSDIDAGSTRSLTALRVLRALRLIKLVRLLRASRMLQRWDCLLYTSPSPRDS